MTSIDFITTLVGFKEITKNFKLTHNAAMMLLCAPKNESFFTSDYQDVLGLSPQHNSITVKNLKDNHYILIGKSNKHATKKSAILTQEGKEVKNSLETILFNQ